MGTLGDTGGGMPEEISTPEVRTFHQEILLKKVFLSSAVWVRKLSHHASRVRHAKTRTKDCTVQLTFETLAGFDLPAGKPYLPSSLVIFYPRQSVH